MASRGELVISLWKLKALGWVSLLFFGFCTWTSWQADQRGASLMFLPFILLTIPLLLQAGRIHITSRAIRLSIPLGHFEMEWNEVKLIKQGQSYTVFFDDERRLNIPNREWWGGSDKFLFHDLLEAFIEEREIDVIPSFTADFLLPKGTRISKNRSDQKTDSSLRSQ